MGSAMGQFGVNLKGLSILPEANKGRAFPERLDYDEKTHRSWTTLSQRLREKQKES